MNSSYRSSRSKQRRGASRTASAILFVAFAVVGLWVHYNVLPIPIQSGPAIVARYVYFLAWLGTLIHLIGHVIFGSRVELWHVGVFFLLGGVLGAYGGILFAGPLGCLVGGFSGVVAGPAIFITRKRQYNGAAAESD